ncbi:MAG: hypothetical protein IIA65_09470, partial [Planctomycetes bacterium]|nr:hypothetical protein [Planctomycetota bacterium]
SVRSGQSWISERDSVVVNGRIEIPEPVSLMLNESPVDFNRADGTWSSEVVVRPGLNTVRAQAWADDANLVDANSIDIVYLPPDNHLSGELIEDTTLTGAWLLDDTLSVPKDVTLSITPGTWILMTEGSGLVIGGRLVAEGEEAAPIYFTHYGEGTTWKQILFSESADSTLTHCVFEYADSAGAHQDYYVPGPRNYHEAIVLLASHVTFKDCLFRHLPDDSGQGEGDAMAVIADDPDVPGPASALVEGCQFLRIGQGLHTRYAYFLARDPSPE